MIGSYPLSAWAEPYGVTGTVQPGAVAIGRVALDHGSIEGEMKMAEIIYDDGADLSRSSPRRSPRLRLAGHAHRAEPEGIPELTWSMLACAHKPSSGWVQPGRVGTRAARPSRRG